MVARCTIPSSTFFSDYGARGICVCDRWKKFENFLADMGERPDGMTLDRIDNNQGYEPGNCRWATRREQANNRRSNLRFTYEGKSYTLAELARHTGVRAGRLRLRLVVSKLPWTVEGAVRSPPLPNGGSKFYC